MKFIKFVFIFILTFISIPNFSFADVNKFVFVTEIQNIEPNTLSDDITIQSQDESGNKISTEETFDIVFQSSSVTGLFLNSSESLTSKTMSKGTSNRTFYYKDQNSGSYVITVFLKGRTTGKEYQVSQNISVGQEIPTYSQSLNQDSVGKEEILKDENNLGFKIKSIKDKKVLVGSEVYFDAQIYSGKQTSYSRFAWNFGDGFVKEGQKVFHTYRFAGKYQVVLKVSDGQASEIIKFFVVVKNPNIKIQSTQDGVKILNKNEEEFSLNGFVLTNGISYFNFPENTIIPAKEEIIFPKEATYVSFGNIKLLDNLGKIVAVNDIVSKESTTTVIKNTDVYAKDVSLKKESVKHIPKKSVVDLPVKENKIEDQVSKTDEVIYKTEVKESVTLKFGNWLKSLFRN